MNLNSGFKEEPGLIELKLKFQIQLVQFAYFLSSHTFYIISSRQPNLWNKFQLRQNISNWLNRN